MERADSKVLANHWHWEKDSEGLVWLTFDKQGESANTFSNDALHQLSAALKKIQLANPKGLIIRSATPVQNSCSDVSASGRTKTRSASDARSNSRIPRRPSAITSI